MNKSLVRLAIPLFFETGFIMIFGSIDVLMLAKYSDDAVAAVGLSNTVLNLVLVLLNVVVAAVAVLVSHHIGANKQDAVQKVAKNAILINFLIGIFLSLVMVVLKDYILDAIHTPLHLRKDAMQYLLVLGSTIFVIALSQVCASILRAHGQAKTTMKLTMFCSFVNVVLNVILIYGIPNVFVGFGVVGAAIATLLSRILLLYLTSSRVKQLLGVSLFDAFRTRLDGYNVKRIFYIGAPRAMESFSYSLLQVVITAFIARLGASQLSVQVYIANVVMFSFLVAVALADAGQILVGYNIGAKQIHHAKQIGNQALIYGIISTILVVTVLYTFNQSIFRLLTNDKVILSMIAQIMLIEFLYEIGRSTNIISQSLLYGAQDALVPLLLSIILMWVLAIPFAYLFAFKLGFGLVGIYLGLALDEIIRGVVILTRWLKGAWVTTHN